MLRSKDVATFHLVGHSPSHVSALPLAARLSGEKKLVVQDEAKQPRRVMAGLDPAIQATFFVVLRSSSCDFA